MSAYNLLNKQLGYSLRSLICYTSAHLSRNATAYWLPSKLVGNFSMSTHTGWNGPTSMDWRGGLDTLPVPFLEHKQDKHGRGPTHLPSFLTTNSVTPQEIIHSLFSRVPRQPSSMSFVQKLLLQLLWHHQIPFSRTMGVLLVQAFINHLKMLVSFSSQLQVIKHNPTWWIPFVTYFHFVDQGVQTFCFLHLALPKQQEFLTR